MMSGLVLLWANAWAGHQLYGADIHSASWEVQSSAINCSLSQMIPGYGKAVFSRSPKSGLNFKMYVKQPANRADIAQLSSHPPQWKHFTRARDLGSVPVIKGNIPFYLGELSTERLLAELEEGMSPTFVYSDWVDGSDEVTVKLTAINFKSALDEFRDCQGGLLGFTFSDVRKTVLLFNKKQTSLDSAAQSELDKVARILIEDSSIKRARIDSYTDSKGLSRINKVIAQKRGNMVKAYLVKQGVTAKRLQVIAHDETEAPFSNRTKEGRMKNRRVVVTLTR